MQVLTDAGSLSAADGLPLGVNWEVGFGKLANELGMRPPTSIEEVDKLMDCIGMGHCIGGQYKPDQDQFDQAVLGNLLAGNLELLAGFITQMELFRDNWQLSLDNAPAQ